MEHAVLDRRVHSALHGRPGRAAIVKSSRRQRDGPRQRSRIRGGLRLAACRHEHPTSTAIDAAMNVISPTATKTNDIPRSSRTAAKPLQHGRT